jgi:hypothetical protein
VYSVDCFDDRVKGCCSPLCIAEDGENQRFMIERKRTRKCTKGLGSIDGLISVGRGLGFAV